MIKFLFLTKYVSLSLASYTLSNFVLLYYFIFIKMKKFLNILKNLIKVFISVNPNKILNFILSLAVYYYDRIWNYIIYLIREEKRVAFNFIHLPDLPPCFSNKFIKSDQNYICVSLNSFMDDYDFAVSCLELIRFIYSYKGTIKLGVYFNVGGDEEFTKRIDENRLFIYTETISDENFSLSNKETSKKFNNLICLFDSFDKDDIKNIKLYLLELSS